MGTNSFLILKFIGLFLCLFTEKFTYSQAGNVGIGTTSPQEKLHVQGNVKADTAKPNIIRITTNAGSGKVLTSDVSGNATWQEAKTSNLGFGAWGDCSMNGISGYQPTGDSIGSDYGYSVSISGNYAIVGDPYKNRGGLFDAGGAAIYQYTGGRWVFMQNLVDQDGGAYDYFGFSVSISGNYAIVGAPGDDVGANTDQGSVIPYILSGGTWLQLSKITDPTGAASDKFGSSVSVSNGWAIAGTPLDDVGANVDQGSICFYQYQAPAWQFRQKFTATGGTTGDYFGCSVSVNGTRAIAGAYGDDVGANGDQGSAVIYAYNGSTWSAMGTITDPGGAAGDQFGYSVSLYSNYAIAGAPNDDAGANTDQGSAVIFWYNNSNWAYLKKLIDPESTSNDNYGYSVSISGNYAIVGISEYDVGTNLQQGSAVIYARVGHLWQKVQKVTDPGGTDQDKFGYAASIDGSTRQFVIGAPFFGSGKAVFGKVN